jgi:hypothetical protein
MRSLPSVVLSICSGVSCTLRAPSSVESAHCLLRETVPALLMDRNNGPEVMLAPAAQLSMEVFTQSGTGIVRTWPPFPLRSTIAQWRSRSWKSSNLRAVTSALRRPQCQQRNALF